MAIENKASKRYYYVIDPNENPARSTHPLYAFSNPKHVADIAIAHLKFVELQETIPYKTYGVIVESSEKSIAVPVEFFDHQNKEIFINRLRQAAAKATAEYIITNDRFSVTDGYEPSEIEKMDMGYIVGIGTTTRYKFGSATMAARVAKKMNAINKTTDAVIVMSAFGGGAVLVDERSNINGIRQGLIGFVERRKKIIAER